MRTITPVLFDARIIPPRTVHSADRAVFPDYLIEQKDRKINELRYLVEQKTQENERLFNVAMGAASILFVAGLVLGALLVWRP